MVYDSVLNCYPKHPKYYKIIRLFGSTVNRNFICLFAKSNFIVLQTSGIMYFILNRVRRRWVRHAINKSALYVLDWLQKGMNCVNYKQYVHNSRALRKKCCENQQLIGGFVWFWRRPEPESTKDLEEVITKNEATLLKMENRGLREQNRRGNCTSWWGWCISGWEVHNR